MFTREDPFSIYKALEKSKVSAPARAGQKAPNDISIPAGPTPFPAGPMIGEFGQLGIKTEVKEGKISIKEDKLLLKEGDEIKPKVADLLAKLGIEPMRIGINLTLAYENGMIYRKDVLGVSEEEYISNIRLGSSQAFNLAMLISYTTKDTIQTQFLNIKFNSRGTCNFACCNSNVVLAISFQINKHFVARNNFNRQAA